MQKTILITGSSSGFGRLCVDRFLADGWFVIATLRRAAERRSLFSEMEKKADGRLAILEGDVTRSEDRKKLAEWIRDHRGLRLDALLNNAGFGLFGPLEELTEEELRYQMEVNFTGTVLLTQALLPAIRQAKGCIITVSSFLGVHCLPFTTGYCASKFAVEGWMESMDGELRQHGVRCYLVEPGGYPTEFGDSITWSTLASDSPYRSDVIGYQALRVEAAKKNARKDPGAVARLIHKLAVKRPNGLRYAIGLDAVALMLLGRFLPRNVFHNVTIWIFQRLLKRVAST